MGCGSDDPVTPPSSSPPPAPVPTTLQLNFNPVAKSVADVLTVPAGYTATVLYALGDPLAAAVPDYANNGSDTGASFALRAGDHHDGMEYFGLDADGTLATGLLHPRPDLHQPREHHPDHSCTPAGPTVVAGVRTVADEVLKEINAHGVADLRDRAHGDQRASPWCATRPSTAASRPTRPCPSPGRRPAARYCAR